MKFRTICAWCNYLISEKECSENKNSLALSKNGVMTSHGLCSSCRKNLEIIYGLNNKGGDEHGLVR